MKVVAVPREQYGSFYKGDSYIILSVSSLKSMLLYIKFTTAHVIFFLCCINSTVEIYMNYGFPLCYINIYIFLSVNSYKYAFDFCLILSF